MEVDRQALLEQKRQRLNELKQRRLQKEKEDAEKAQIKQAEEDVKVKKVDFAVQVGESTEISRPQVVAKPSLVIRFDKAIQVEPEVFEEEIEPETEAESPVVDDIPQEVEPLKEEVVNEALESQLESQLHFPFSKLRLGIKDKHELRSVGDSPFTQSHPLSDFLDRPIRDIKTTLQFPDLLLVAYGPPKSKKSDLTNPLGLAIVFNASTESIFPEFFLHSTSIITTIEFDKSDAFRIIAGMENGRLALWDLTNVKSDQLSVLPTLQTSTVASFFEKSKKGFIYHSSPIILIEQPDVNTASPSMVTICANGVINVWSLSILAFPKLPSKTIQPSSGAGVDVTSVLMSSNYMLSTDTSHHAPEFKFLNNTYVGSVNGDIIKLKNSKDGRLVDRTYSSAATAAALSIAETSWKHNQSTSTILLSSHMDWTLKLWHHSSQSPLHSISTGKITTKIQVRPCHEFQFVTLNAFTPPEGSSSVDYWDLKVRCLAPVCSVPLLSDFGVVALVAFDSEGSSLTIGSKTGQLTVLAIDQIQLDTVNEQRTNRNIDGGVMQYLDSINLGM